MLDRFFFCWIILAAFLLTFFQSTREDLSVETAPTRWHALFLMRLCFLLGGVALAAFVLAIRPGGLENFSVKAAPPACFAIPDRFLFSRKPLTAFLMAVEVRHLDDCSVEATPTPLYLTIVSGLIQRVVALAASRLVIGRPHYIDLSVDTAVAPTR